jgi:hypothetical protein
MNANGNARGRNRPSRPARCFDGSQISLTVTSGPARRHRMAGHEPGRDTALPGDLIGLPGGKHGIAEDGHGHGKTVRAMTCLADDPAGAR